MRPRLTTAVFVSSLLRLAEQQGGFGAVVAKGDATAGAVLVLLAERGRRVALLERLLQADGRYAWGSPLAAGHNEADLDKFLARRRGFDPDLWIVELDTASAERFAAEMSALD